MTLRRPLPRVSAACLLFRSQAAWALVRVVLGVLLPLWLVFGAGNAWAVIPVRGMSSALPAPGGSAAAENQAPMCDVHAASVAARAEVPEIDQGKLEPLPCDALFALVGWGKELRELASSPSVARHAAPPSDPAAAPLVSRPEGLIEQQRLLSPVYETAFVPDARLEGVSASPGHFPPVYRPPVRG